MNRRIVRTVLYIIAFAAVIACAVFAYNYLSANFVDGGESADFSNVPAGSVDTDKSGQTSEAGETAPDFTVIDTDGNEVSLSDFAGKPVIINFWATWCGPCKIELPDFDSLYAEYADDVVFLMINLTDGRRDTVESVKKFVSDSGYTFPVYFDTGSSAADAYNIYSIPVTVAVYPDGTVAKRRTGALGSADIEALINLISQ